MAATYTTFIALARPSTGDTGWGLTLDANFDAIDALGAVGPLAVAPAEVPSASRNVKVAAGTFRRADGTAVAYAGTASLALAASATHSLWLDDSGALQHGTAGFPAGNLVRLAAVVTGASTVTSVADARTPWQSFGAAAGGATVGGTLGGSPAAGSLLYVGTGGTLAQQALTGLVFATGTTFRAAAGADLPAFGGSGPAHAPGAVPDPGATAGTTRYLREDGAWTAPPGGGSSAGTVTSVALALPGDLAVTGSPITSSGTLAVSRVNQAANTALLGPPSGATAAPAYRALVPADLPALGASGTGHQAGAAPDPGGTTGTSRYLREDATWVIPLVPDFVGSGPAHARGGVPDPGATAGTTRFLREDGAWSALAGTEGGTVSSVGLTLPADFAVTGSPVTATGTLAGAWANQAANLVHAGPAAGAAAAPSWRALAPADLPALGASGAAHQAGAAPDPGGSAGTTRFLREDASWQVPPAGSGTVTSVGLSAPAWLAVTGSPVTTGGTLALAAAAGQTANRVLATPDGTAGAVGLRALAAGDLPTTGLRVDSHYGTITADTDGATVTFDLAASDKHEVTLGGNRTLAVTGATAGQTFEIALKQDGTGSRTVTWWSGVRWGSAGAPALTPTANKEDIFLFRYRGSGDYRGFVVGQGY